jgi:TolB protein
MNTKPILKFVSALCLSTAALGVAAVAQVALPPETPAPAAAGARPPQQNLRSRLFVYDLRTGKSTLVFTADKIWEAPSWSPDGKYLISNSDNHIYKLTFSPDGMVTPTKLAIPDDYRCNNDKAISPDGKKLGFSATLAPAKGSNVFLADADGTNIKQMTTEAPSYFHGWSPDNKIMAFVAYRNGQKQFDVWSIPAAGGSEKQLDADTHHDDGPDYSPDGKWIYVNSDRSGREAVWRFPADGAGPNDAKAEKVVDDGLEDWFPHISPDGKKMVYICYPAGTPTHGPRTVHVEIKLVPVAAGNKVGTMPKLLEGFTGGQGSLNVNSWAPDSQRFAYVSYEVIP